MRKTRLDEQLDTLGYMRIKSMTVPKSFCLYRKDTHEFRAVFSKDRDKIVFNGKRYKTVEDFLKDVEEFNKTLYFPSDTYNPDYRKEFVDEMRVRKTLYDSGLERAGHSIDNYIFEDKMSGRFAQVNGTDLMLSETSWIPLKDQECPVDEASCKKIKSVLAAVYAYHISELVEVLNRMGRLDNIKSVKVKTFDFSTLQTVEKEGKDGIVAKLEEVLSILKS